MPMALAIMIPQLSILTNTIFLGNYESADGLVHGKDVLSVAGVAGLYYYVFAIITFGLGSGILMLMSRKAGEDQSEGVGYVFSVGFWLALFLSIVLLLLSIFLATFFFQYVLHNNGLQVLAKDYALIRMWGLPFVCLAHLGNMLFIATNRTRLMLFGTLGETIITILLDYCFIFGHWGFPELGIMGAAIASVVAEIVFFIIVFAIIHKNHYFKQFHIRLFNRVKFKDLRDYFFLSSPLMIQFFISIGAWEVFFIFVEHLGEHELGASQIVRSIYGIMGIAVWALANTANSMVSNLYGQKEYDAILPLLNKIVRITLSYALVVVTILYIVKLPLIAMYTADEKIRALSSPTMNVVFLASFIFSASLIYFNGMLGLGNTRRNLAYESITITCYLLYCYIVVEVLSSPLWVAWTSELIYWLVMLLLSGFYMKSKKWVPEKL